MQAKSPNHQHNNKTKPIFQFLPGPVKIKDGLFMGDQIAAKDIEFIISNKVTHIINTVSKKIPNLWERFGIHYLSVNWTQKQQNIFDKKNNAVNTIFHFIQQAMEQGESCLIHSVNGKSRACAVLVAYLMKKYGWSLDKCLEFTASKKENLQIRNGYLLQLKELDERMSQIYNLTSTWDNPKTQQELILKNTFTNSQAPTTQVPKPSKKGTKHISWGEKPTIFKVNQNKTHQPPQKTSQIKLKSILKGDQGDVELIKNIEQSGSFEEFGEGKPPKKQKNFINNINGNIVHVTVNNFITSEKSDKKKEEKTPVNTRPYSSDQKERDKEKQKKIINQKKLLVYDTNPMVGMKSSPYDAKIAGRIGSNSKIPKPKKEQKQIKTTAYERPQSAKHRTAPITNKSLKQDLVVMNSATNSMGQQKKRYPSNPRQQFFKRR